MCFNQKKTAQLITLQGTRYERYRTLGVGVLIATILAEGYFTSTAHIQIPQNDASAVRTLWAPNGVFMVCPLLFPLFLQWLTLLPSLDWQLHDNLYLLRQLVFLLLPPAIHFILPPSPLFAVPGSAIPGNPNANAQVPQTPHAAALMTLQALIPKLQLLRYTRGAIMRTPALRDTATEWWCTEKQEGEWVREDEGVRNTARQLGIGFGSGPASTTIQPGSAGIGGVNSDTAHREEGPLRVNAKAAARNLIGAFATWRPGPGSGHSDNAKP